MRDSGGGGGGGGGGTAPGEGVGAGGTMADPDGVGDATELGELVPIKVSAGAPSGFHLIPWGKCFRTYFASSLRSSVKAVCHSLCVVSPLHVSLVCGLNTCLCTLLRRGCRRIGLHRAFHRRIWVLRLRPWSPIPMLKCLRRRLQDD